MIINNTGLQIIIKFEGFSSTPYLCPAGIPTIGYGSTYLSNGQRVTMSHIEISRDEAMCFLMHEVESVAVSLSHCLKVSLNSNQFSALVSLGYNVGMGNVRASTLLRHINRGDFESAQGEFWKWRRANGKILKGLVRRRKLEELLFASELTLIP